MNRILKRIIASYGINNRQSALVYINGEIILGRTHPEIIFDYLIRNGLLDNFVATFYHSLYNGKRSKDRIEQLINNKIKLMRIKHQFDDNIKDAIWEYGFRNLSFSNMPLALGHYIYNVSGKEKIALIVPSIVNTNLSKVITTILDKYPHAVIIDDDTSETLMDTSINLEVDETFISQWIDTKNKFGPKDSIFDKFFRQELSLIDNYKNCNIIYKNFSNNNFWVKVNVQLQSFNQSDEDVINSILKAIKNAVIKTNQYFLDNNIDNLLTITKPYTLMFN